MDKSRLSTQALLLLISKNFQSIVVFVLSMLIIRVLNKFDYGTFQQANLIAMTVSLIMIFGIPYSVFYFIPTLAAKKEFLIQTFVFLSVLGITSSIGLLFFKDKICVWMNNPSLNSLIIIISIYTLLLIPFQMMEPMFISIEKTHLYSWINIILGLIQLGVVGSAILLGGKLQIILLSMACFSLFAYIFLFAFILFIPQKMGKILECERIKSQIQYSFPLGLSGITSTLCIYLDQYIISWFYPPENFAVYSRGAMDIPFISIVPVVVLNVVMPHFVRLYASSKIKELMALWDESIRKMALVLFPVFVFFFIVANQVITFIYTDNYSESTAIFRVYLFLIILRIIGGGVVIRAMGMTKVNFYSSLLYLILHLGLSLLLVNLFGLIGPAISGILSFTIANWGYLLLRIAKEMKMSYRQICPWSLMIKIMAISLLPAGVCFFIPSLSLSKLGLIGLCSLIYFPCYIFLLFVFKMLTSDDIVLIKGWLRNICYPGRMKDKVAPHVTN